MSSSKKDGIYCKPAFLFYNGREMSDDVSDQECQLLAYRLHILIGHVQLSTQRPYGCCRGISLNHDACHRLAPVCLVSSFR